MNDRKKISRNNPCPCGSGLKYKKCCCNTTGNRLPDAILSLAEDLFSKAENEEEWRFIIEMICLAWNIAVAAEENQIEENVKNLLEATAEGDNECYPDINDIILQNELTLDEGKIHLDISSIPEEVAKSLNLPEFV